MNAPASPVQSSELESRYRRILALGEGGMAEVLLAVGKGPSGFNKLVVLKVMRRELVGDLDLRRMFLAEARLSARLNHANVVQVYEVLDRTTPCLVMEYLDGQSMAAVIRKGRGEFSLPMHLRVISEALRGLHYTHELSDYDGTPLNLVHRDVSPENVFITYDGHAKVLDFGVAKAADVPGQTKTGVIKGKIAYMPREQLLGEEVDRRADIHAVGCMLWHAAAGRKLRHGMQQADVMRALIDGEVPPPSAVRAVDPDLEVIVMKALAPDANDRYQTAEELQQEVDRYLAKIAPTLSMREVGELASALFEEDRHERSKTIHSSLSAPNSAPPAVSERPSNAVTVAEPRQKRRSQRWWVYIGIVATVLTLLLGGVVLGSLSRGDTAAPEVASSPAPEPQLVSVRVTVAPTEASVMIDGKRYGDNPVLLTVPPDNKKHEVKGILVGYETEVKSIRFSKDVAVELSLDKLPEASPSPEPSSEEPPKPKGPRVSPPLPPTTSPVRPPSQLKCSPPYYYKDGIKQFKPGCI